MIKHVLILLMVVSPVFAKKLQIHKCYATNGTILFQEDPCELGVSKKQIKQQNKMTKPGVHKPVVTLQVYQSPSPSPSVTSSKIQYATKIVRNKVKGYDVSLKVKQTWKVVNKVYNNKLLHLEFVEKTSYNQIEMLVDFIYTDGKRFSEKELLELVYLSGSRFVKGSNEGQINAYSFEINKGKGVMATLTHSIAGFRDKILSKGVIYKNGWLVQFTYNGEDINSPSHQFVLHSLFKNMQINKI